MAQFEIRYLVEKPGPTGGLPRYYWQPGPDLRRRGFTTVRVPKDRRGIVDLQTMQAAAVAEAAQLNRWADMKRAAEPSLPRAAKAPEAPHTVDELIRRYRTTEFWQRLSLASKRGYDQCLARISAWAGGAPVMAIDWDRIAKLAASMKATPSYRNHVLRMLRILLNHGTRLGWLLTNPAQRPPLEHIEHSGLVWPREAIDKFVATADAMGRHSIGTAVICNEWFGQRQGDLLRLTRALLRDGTLLIRQSKTGARVALPFGRIPHVCERLSQELARIDARPWLVKPLELIVDETLGRHYNPDRFRHLFDQIRTETAKVHPYFETDFIQPGKSMHDADACRLPMRNLTFQHLRHTAVTRLAEAGCEETLIAAVTGHSLNSVGHILQHYLVKTKRLAGEAFDRRLAAERPQSRGLRQMLRIVRGNGS